MNEVVLICHVYLALPSTNYQTYTQIILYPIKQFFLGCMLGEGEHTTYQHIMTKHVDKCTSVRTQRGRQRLHAAQME